jgi:hypothetical protein
MRCRSNSAFDLNFGLPGASNGPGRCLIHVNTQRIEAPTPAAPRQALQAGAPMICVFKCMRHLLERTGGPWKARCTAEALLSNIAYSYSFVKVRVLCGVQEARREAARATTHGSTRCCSNKAVDLSWNLGEIPGVSYMLKHNTWRPQCPPRLGAAGAGASM